MLDIIIPHYKEPWEIGKPYFDMLACQRLVDFSKIRIILVHDGTDMFPAKYFSAYPFNVEQHRIAHKGVSAARNFGLDLARNEWVTFCDFDDTYSCTYSLKFVFDVLGNNKYDMLWGSFFTENKTNDGNLVLAENKEFNLVWIHNKYYRRSFLKEHKLRFNEKLYFCEDSAFNAMVNTEIDPHRVGTIVSNIPLYVWCYRENSSTTDKSLIIYNMIGHFERNKYVTESFIERGHPDRNAMAARTITDAYINLTRPDIPDGWEQVMDLVRKFYKEHLSELKKVTNEEWQKVARASIREARKSGYLNEDRPLFADWLKEVKCG